MLKERRRRNQNLSQFNEVKKLPFLASRHGIVGNQDKEKKKNISMNIG